MATPVTHKALETVGLLKAARRIKRRLFPCPPENNFRPCTPPLLIAVNRALRWAIVHGLAETGDYLEFGIFRGFTLWYAQALAKDLGINNMRFFGFDSFSGLPDMSGIDGAGEFHTGQYCCSLQEVVSHLDYYGVDWTKTFLVEGFYDETLNQDTRSTKQLEKCSVCVVDCDLYESTLPVLEFVLPMIQDRMVILFDDWGNFGNDPAKGEQRAYAEFLARYKHLRSEPFINFGIHGQGFTIRVQ